MLSCGIRSVVCNRSAESLRQETLRRRATSPVRDVILVATIGSTKANPVGMTQMNVVEIMNRNEKLYTTAMGFNAKKSSTSKQSLSRLLTTLSYWMVVLSKYAAFVQ